MAFSTISLPANTWTKIGDNVTDMSFENVGQWPIYINFTAADSEPTEEIGLVYPSITGVNKKTLSDLTYTASAAYVWAKPLGGKTGKVVVES